MLSTEIGPRWEAPRKERTQDEERDVAFYFIKRFNFCQQQRVAYGVAADSIVRRNEPCGEQFRMVLVGLGRTGKTYTLLALAQFMDSIGLRGQYVVTAPTSSGLDAVHGSTLLHQLLNLTSDPDHWSEVDRQIVRDRLRGVRYIFIDQFYLVGSMMVSWIHTALQIASGNTTDPFGGYNMIFCGDPTHYPPRPDHPLQSPFNPNHGINDRIIQSGMDLFQNATHTVFYRRDVADQQYWQ